MDIQIIKIKNISEDNQVVLIKRIFEDSEDYAVGLRLLDKSLKENDIIKDATSWWDCAVSYDLTLDEALSVFEETVIEKL